MYHARFYALQFQGQHISNINYYNFKKNLNKLIKQISKGSYDFKKVKFYVPF